MKRFYFCTVFGFTALLSANLAAQQTTKANELSLDALVTEALAKNPELNFYRQEIAAARGQRKEAAAFANPELSADFGRKRASGNGLSAEGNAWSVSVLQPFEYPGRIALRKAIANRDTELAQLGYEQFQATLAARIKLLGYKLFIAQEKSVAAEQVARRGGELANTLVQRDPAGITPLLETRIIEANAIVARRRAAQAVKEAQVALYELNQLRGAPLETALKIEKPVWKLPPLENLAVLLGLVHNENFEVRMRQLELAQQGLRVDLSKKERWPTVSAGPFYSQEKADETERTYGLGLSLPLPLWNRNKGNIETAQARAQQAETSLALIQQTLERELLENVATYNALRDEMALWQPDILQQLRDAAELADRHYRLGSLPVATYTELQEKYLDALETILDTQEEALQSWQKIQQLTGKNDRASLKAKSSSQEEK